jgi:REP element-mobilizing transposase RayT
MAQRKEEFINGEIYHITLRGVEGREIFINDDDRWRGIFSLYEFNNTKSITIRRQREKREQFKEKIRRCLAPAELGTIITQEDCRDKLVEILAFVFMPNHVHFIISIESNKTGLPVTAPTIGRIINQMKGYITRNVGFQVWQKDFYERIIQN